MGSRGSLLRCCWRCSQEAVFEAAVSASEIVSGVDVKAVGAVLAYAMIAQDFATLTKAKWLHTTAQHGRVATKSTHYFNQTL